MKQFVKIFGVGLVMMCLVMMVSAVSYAGSGSPQIDPNNPPPYGVVMHGDAKGVKLYGAISVEYTGYNSSSSGSYADNGRAVLQVRTAKGSLTKTFVADVANLPYDPNAQVAALIAAFKEAILNEFFGGNQDLNIVLVSLGEYQITPITADPNYMIASITLAVN